ncbi:type II toxin-antitoxin system YafO family toxin [Pseudomonas sp. AU8050]|uniref:type II toxin-antitoxin system YafO family toxin n=1 Tax=Pseudomonas sp. AU8050 TaxID=2681497 RepID=UPI00140922E1|nr:type II toxin-antitoxin system YafO family toxin [Pseudomonas sp. AU8050]NHC52368.1 hypothetical protein [Pseudomonas sp. AU8050]
MQVDVHPDLESALGSDKATFVTRFCDWKKGDEFGSYFFGKNGGYRTPTLDFPQSQLMHVHLVPLHDVKQLGIWNRLSDRRSRKTSNRVLIYAERSSTQYLLIDILEEADDPHTIANMTTQEDKDMMYAYAAIANCYIESGDILIID